MADPTPNPAPPANTPPAAAPPAAAPAQPKSGPVDSASRELRIVSHSTLFYWWPVWAIGFLMAIVTGLSGNRMVSVHRSSEYLENASVQVDGQAFAGRSVWVFPEKEKAATKELLRVARSKNLGVLYSIVLLLVIAITNVPLRGLWSVIVIVSIIFLSIIFALLDWWEHILSFLSILDIRMNFEGYLLISTVLLALWLVVLFFFDRQIYMVFTPGQLRVRLEIGDAETAYDTTGMTIQKQRSDLFRHWILGLGSGDLIVRTAGAQSHHFDMPNVLFVGRKVKEIEEMLRSRPMLTQKD